MRKNAFTLVELLVVIVIIGLLAGLLLPAVNAVRHSAQKAADGVEISQLDFALQNFKEKFGEYPPDFADVDREVAMRQVRRFIAKAWPRCNRLPRDFRGTDLPANYNAGTALAFWLGGRCNAALDPASGRWLTEYLGFSADPQNPFDVDDAGDPLPETAPPGEPVRSTSRVNPFFRFPNNRIVGTPATNWAFWPQTYLQPTTGAGYVYFRAENRAYATKGFPTLAYGAMVDGRVTTRPWLNPDSYQIRSCGRDGEWYPGETGGWGRALGYRELFPANQPAPWADDMGNCWLGMMEDNL